MSEAPKTVWVTRWAPTKGIIECKATYTDDTKARVEWPGGINDVAHFYGSDWHPTREAALARANEMKAAKIASLKRQIAKLEALTF